MTGRKRSNMKLKLIRESRRARGIPAWIIVKTKGKVRLSNRWRHWRRSKIRL
ncbi:MAG TPA: 50S ribosomal protein L39e [Candidatus Bathyarchaeota archaeon]|nr:50S ribosomal protein L39e [Candidatus Bathyarchaeota archaeon]